MMENDTKARSKEFQEIYEKHLPRVYAYFNLCFGEDCADDLSQQLFLKVWKHVNRPTFVTPDNWKAWLFKVAVNLKNDFLRLHYIHPPCVELMEDSKIVSTQEDDSVLSLSIKQAFSQLKPADKRLLLLKGEGLTSEEIGDILDLLPSTVRSRLVVARQRLKKRLAESGVSDYE